MACQRRSLQVVAAGLAILATGCGDTVVESAATTDGYCADAEVVFPPPDVEVDGDAAETAFAGVVAAGPPEHRPTWEALDRRLDQIDPDQPSYPVGLIAFLQVAMDEEIYPHIREECGFDPLRIFDGWWPDAAEWPEPNEDDDLSTSTIGRLDIDCVATGGPAYEIVVTSEHDVVAGDLTVTAVLYETEDAFADGDSFARVDHEFFDLQPGEVRTTSARTDGATVGYCSTGYTFSGRSTG